MVRTLKGATGWLITDGRAGIIAQARGVAAALDLNAVQKNVAPKGIWHLMAPWGPVAPREQFGKPGSKFAPPWPDVAIAVGRAAIPYIRALRKHAGSKTYTVVLQDPRTNPNVADLICVPQHDRLRADNVFTTLTSAHRFSPNLLEEIRGELPNDIKDLPRPRVAVLLGGKNRAHRYTDDDYDRLIKGLSSLAALGVNFMITPSRRSLDGLIEAADTGTRNAPRIFWRGEGENPYPYFLAAADLFIVTGDSVNMCSEASSTGKPVYVFMPSGGSQKFTRFHDGLQQHGATRPMPELFEILDEWTYEPLDAASEIAAEIERRFNERAQTL